MENATKALLMAGGVLIAIIVLTIGILLYNSYSNQAETYNQIISITEIQKFNSQFEVYVGREDITAQEIVTVVKLAEKCEKEQGIKVNIVVQAKVNFMVQNIDFSDYGKIDNFVKENLDSEFSCKVDNSESKKNPVYNDEGKISKLIFSKK